MQVHSAELWGSAVHSAELWGSAVHSAELWGSAVSSLSCRCQYRSYHNYTKNAYKSIRSLLQNV